MDDSKQAQANEIPSGQLEQIGGGGECTPADLISIVGQLTQTYEGLVDFTSHVIDRVLNGMKS